MSLLGHISRELGLLRRGGTPAHANLRRRILMVLSVSVVLDVAFAGLVLLAEHSGKGTEIHNYGDALFWTTAQLLTVSSQMKNPVTTAGRILDVVLEAYSITVVTSLAGMFGAFFHHRTVERGEMPGARHDPGSASSSG
ncbi:MAG: voltage-gated potassium channel [Solirubrobacteraceae bacterium]|nr:voltage-gated potassium channel [Solirubrobacteraceae bacterium]